VNHIKFAQQIVQHQPTEGKWR